MGAVKSRRRGQPGAGHSHHTKAVSPESRQLELQPSFGQEALVQLRLNTRTHTDKKREYKLLECDHHHEINTSQPQSQALICLCSGDRLIDTDRSGCNRDCGKTKECHCSSSLHSSSQQDKMLYSNLNLDTHPVVTRLQNEQNLRLEGMEQRMNKIRQSADQEAERRKFAHLFRARSEDKAYAEEMLKEASVALELIKKEKEERKASEQRLVSGVSEHDVCVESKPACKVQCDRGDIIPVHVLTRDVADKEQDKNNKVVPSQPLKWLLQPVETFNLNGVVLWLVLPFLLPVLLVLHLVRHLSSGCNTQGRKKAL